MPSYCTSYDLALTLNIIWLDPSTKHYMTLTYLVPYVICTWPLLWCKLKSIRFKLRYINCFTWRIKYWVFVENCHITFTPLSPVYQLNHIIHNFDWSRLCLTVCAKFHWICFNTFGEIENVNCLRTHNAWRPTKGY